MRCTYCGNENPEGNRFCGMCGGTLLTPKVAAAQAQSTAGSSHATAASAGTASRPRPPEPQRPVPDSDSSPIISGPSFLGLSDAPPPRGAPVPARRRGSLSIDPDSSTSRNLDYLLDDEEEPRHGGAGKIFLILLVLALAVGFGYLGWKDHSFGWLGSLISKPSSTQTTAPPAGSDSASAPAPSVTPEAQPPATTPAEKTTQPAAQPSASATDAAKPPAPAPATTPAPAATTSDNSSNPPATTDSGSAPATAQPDAPAADTTAKAAAPSPANKQPSASDDNNSADQPDTTSDQPKAKPPAAAKPAPFDAIATAQRYLYGKGVPQNCERGLRLLKPPADQGNPKAMVEMGALYSAGLCTPHDLPTAYRWFALALRKDPSNQAIQTDLQKLWGEMTQPERQLAIRLTQ